MRRHVRPAICLLAVLFASHALAAKAERPNVLLIVTDDQRPDTIHALGNDVIVTPNLDRLVQRGMVFTRAICAHPLCVPSRAEMLTGCTGFRNGVHPPRNMADLQLPTWPQTMQQAGYETCWTGKWHLAGRPSQRGIGECLGLFTAMKGSAPPIRDYRGQTVTGYIDWIFQRETPGGLVGDPERGGGMTATISETFADCAIEMLQRPHQRPFFLQVNFTAPHDPLLVLPEYARQYEGKVPLPANFAPEHPFDHGNLKGRDEVLLASPRTREDIVRNLEAYYAVISHLDAQIGRVLDALETARLAESTIVIFTSDHGLALGSHGLTGKQNMYEHTIGVPLILAGPGIASGSRNDAQCYLRDLYPTVCELCGIEVPPSVEGKSLVPALQGERAQIHPHVIGYYADSQRMIRTRRWKYVWYPQANREQLFDLLSDPHELNDCSAEAQHAGIRDELRTSLLEWLREHGDPVAQ